MLPLKKLLNPRSYISFLRGRFTELVLRLTTNMRGAVLYRPGHFYSPLLDIKSIKPNDENLAFDGVQWWENIDLRTNEQKCYYEELFDTFPLLQFPPSQAENFRYFTENSWFVPSDAFLLSGLIRKERPQRIIEVGSGFSSAVILDTLHITHQALEVTCIEPNSERLDSLMTAKDRSEIKIIKKQVQEVPLTVFGALEAQDILFIDSSHVAKAGSDVSFLILRVLPRLQRGVFVHFHDIFYPYSLPLTWIMEGRAWNESLFLRAFLVGNTDYEIVAFNSFAAEAFPEVFQARFPAFLENSGGSLWIKKVR